jgi:hypothetical protein
MVRRAAQCRDRCIRGSTIPGGTLIESRGGRSSRKLTRIALVLTGCPPTNENSVASCAGLATTISSAGLTSACRYSDAACIRREPDIWPRPAFHLQNAVEHCLCTALRKDHNVFVPCRSVDPAGARVGSYATNNDAVRSFLRWVEPHSWPFVKPSSQSSTRQRIRV